MFVKLARSRGHTYAQIVESFRDANGQPRQRNLLTLGPRVRHFAHPKQAIS